MSDLAILSVAVPATALGGFITAIGAVTGWHKLIDWADQHTNTSPLPIRPARQPIAALTAVPHHEAADELGPWNPSQHRLMPALLAGETFVNTVNTGVTS
ncbi:hypothetical protein [Micromonospora chersina]|uniref:hypothetical protein n=1 Tax=Micromonospora chersina TaxID=47854 RepID=UPI003712BD0E